MELKDKLNLLWKFLFLAVFTYAVYSMTCCQTSASSSCCTKSEQVAPCSLDKSSKNISQNLSGSNYKKPCCSKNK